MYLPGTYTQYNSIFTDPLWRADSNYICAQVPRVQYNQTPFRILSLSSTWNPQYLTWMACVQLLDGLSYSAPLPMYTSNTRLHTFTQCLTIVPSTSLQNKVLQVLTSRKVTLDKFINLLS
jgi:hypothetical protein